MDRPIMNLPGKRRRQRKILKVMRRRERKTKEPLQPLRSRTLPVTGQSLLAPAAVRRGGPYRLLRPAETKGLRQGKAPALYGHLHKITGIIMRILPYWPGLFLPKPGANRSKVKWQWVRFF